MYSVLTFVEFWLGLRKFPWINALSLYASIMLAFFYDLPWVVAFFRFKIDDIAFWVWSGLPSATSISSILLLIWSRTSVPSRLSGVRTFGGAFIALACFYTAWCGLKAGLTSYWNETSLFRCTSGIDLSRSILAFEYSWTASSLAARSLAASAT